MDYTISLFLNQLPVVLTESRIINGKEQTCLILPVEDNQLKKGRWGNWIMPIKAFEEPPNPKGYSHKLALQWRDVATFKKAIAQGVASRTRHLGTMVAYDSTIATESKEQNQGQDLDCHGEIVLSDIPKEYIFKNKQTGKRFITNLKLKSKSDDSFVWVGTISVDEIPRHHILEHTDSGKEYIKVRFKKLMRKDLYMNTHILVLDLKDGSEIEVGRFREFKKDGVAVRNELSPDEIHDTPVNQRRPESIDGLRF